MTISRRKEKEEKKKRKKTRKSQRNQINYKPNINLGPIFILWSKLRVLRGIEGKSGGKEQTVRGGKGFDLFPLGRRNDVKGLPLPSSIIIQPSSLLLLFYSFEILLLSIFSDLLLSIISIITILFFLLLSIILSLAFIILLLSIILIYSYLISTITSLLSSIIHTTMPSSSESTQEGSDGERCVGEKSNLLWTHCSNSFIAN